jgi:sulfate adenylyltransferase subunit 2
MRKILPKHLRRLEAESIEIMREVVAEFKNPVMLYSIGKDSSVMLHLAVKAFYPAPLPFPLMHIDTTWKFREMIAFRDQIVRRLGVNLIVYVNPEGLERGVSPIASGSSLHTHVMKTEALKQALDLHRFDAAFGGAPRRGEKPGEGTNLFIPLARSRLGSPQSAAGAMEFVQYADRSRGDDPGVPAVELDRT